MSAAFEFIWRPPALVESALLLVESDVLGLVSVELASVWGVLASLLGVSALVWVSGVLA